MLRQPGSYRIFVILLIAMNLLVTWFLYRFLFPDFIYLANDAWQFNESAFRKTRGASRYLTIPAHPYLHNLKPALGVALDAISFALLLLSLTIIKTENRAVWAVTFFTIISLPLWPVVVNWFPWPAQMSVINFVTAGYFYWTLKRSNSFKSDLVLSVIYIFICLGYYEIYCLFAAFIPFYKSYNFKSYIIFMITVLVAIFLAYGLALLYQLQFWGDVKKISGYRVLSQTDGMPFWEKYWIQYLDALKSIKFYFVPQGILGVLYGIAWLTLIGIAVSNHRKFLHMFIIIGMFVSMYAVMNHIILHRNMLPLFVLPIAIFMALSRDASFKHSIMAGIATSIISIGYAFQTNQIVVEPMQEKHLVMSEMIETTKAQLSGLTTDKTVIFIGSRPQQLWAVQYLNAVSYNLDTDYDISSCSRQLRFGKCGRDLKQYPEFKTWLCSNPPDFARFETDKHLYFSIGRPATLDCS